MKILRINDNQGKFLLSDGKYKDVIDISKEDIYRLSELILDSEAATIDMEQDITQISNEASRIIYKNLRVELNKIIKERDSINDSINDLFKEAEDKYKQD